MITVEELMTPEPHTLAPSATLADARRLMAERRIRHIPVVDGERLVGLVTETDVLRAMDSVLDPERQHDESGVSVASFMREDPATVNLSDRLRSAALFMESHRYGCLPIMDGERLVGIITDTDFVGLAINLLEQAELLDED